MSDLIKTRLVNIRKHRSTSVVRIDRTSRFGNPFYIGKDGNREEVIEKYEQYFYKRIDQDRKFRWAVAALKGLTLACWCTPLPCHGDIIIAYLEEN